MERLHRVEEDDDLYSGYDGPTLDYEDLDNDVGFQQAVRSIHRGRRPMTAIRPGTITGPRPSTTSFGSRMATSTSRPVTAGQNGATRPMTAVTGAGYTSSRIRGSNFDPLGWSGGATPPLEAENMPEEKLKLLEKKVMDLLQESAIAHGKGASELALQKAKEARREERALAIPREQSANIRKICLPLKFSVLLNLANQYENNKMYTEALKTYQAIVKDKTFENAGRLTVNQGNIYFKQKQYPQALKLYRKALDQISSTHKEIRMKILQNIGAVLIKMGRYSDAITSYLEIMSESPNVHVAYNLIICSCAIGDREMMKEAFQRLISVPLRINNEDKDILSDDDAGANIVAEAFKNDELHQMERDLKVQAEKYIMSAAKLIAPAIDTSFATQLDWCIDMVKTSQYYELANELQTNKALAYFKQNDFDRAEEILKTCVKNDSTVKSAAATNLSALYLMKKDYDQAEQYANIAISADHYNAAALTCMGNVHLEKDHEKAAEFYKEALRNDSCCTEALYNLGLAFKKLDCLEEALDCFLKLHAILRNSTQVMYQLADLYECLGDPQRAIDWLKKVSSVTPTDAHVLAKLGKLHDNEGDQALAFQYYYESFRLFPSNIKVIEWLGAFYIDRRFYERAIQYFEKATLIQPRQVKWQLLVASSYRRSGCYQKALETCKDIHRRFPENVECLHYLLRLCTDMRLKEVEEYATKLKKVERRKNIRKQSEESEREGRVSRASNAGERGRSGNSGSSTGRKYLRASIRSLPSSNEPYEASSPKQMDASYVDPLGPQMERPKTGMKDDVRNYFADMDLQDDLLPQ